MYVLHIRFSRKKFACCAALAAAVTAAAVLLGGCLSHDDPAPPQSISAATNAERISYLTEQGWEAAEDPVETLDLLLPEDLSVDYSDYCKLQSQQGFPFDQYGGRQVTRYTYTITNYPDIAEGVQANLYVCDGHVIAGDIIATGDGGFQQGLAFPETE